MTQPSKPEAAIAQHVAAPPQVSFLVTFFLNVFLPILPSLLLAAAPQIKTSPKLQAVLKAADDVIDQLIGEQS